MGNIKDSLQKSLNRLGISRQVEAAGVVEAAQREVAKYIPEEDFEVISFKEGTLKIAASSSSVANEIQLHNKDLKNLKEVNNIKIILGN